MFFLRRIVVSNHKNFLLHLFLKNGQVQYSFENKAYLKPCIYMKKDNSGHFHYYYYYYYYY